MLQCRIWEVHVRMRLHSIRRFYMSVFAGKVFGTQADRLCLYGGACRPAVACVAVAYRYIWIDGRGGYSTAFALDERAAHRQPVERMNHQAAYYVF